MQDQIDEIMDTFDFTRVQEIMTRISWKWDAGERAHIPEEAELRKEARRMMRVAVDSSYASTGGFAAVVHDGMMTLHWGISAP